MAKRIPESTARDLFIRNDLKPLEPFPGTQKPWRSKCLRTGKEVSPTYGKVRDFGHRCQHCSGYKVDQNEALNIMKKAGLKPLIVYPGSNKPWKSECNKCKKTTSPTLSSVKRGTRCKYCSSRAVDPIDAVAAMQKRGFTPLEDFPGATVPWEVRCNECGREFQTYFHSLRTQNRCKFCQGVAIDNKMLSQVLEKLKLRPLEPFPGAKTPWKLRCLRCNRVVTPSWTHLTRKDRNVGGCVFCSRRRVHMDELIALLTKKKLKPIGQFVNGKTPWLCVCLKCGREVYPLMNSLIAGASGCVYCIGRKVDISRANELANLNGFTPLVPYPGANKGWDCVCNVCGKVSKPRYTSMQQGINRCKYCSTGGFDFNKPAIVYLITNESLGAHKIGVAGASVENERLRKHEKQSWTIYKQVKLQSGSEAYEIESLILKWLRYERELPPYLSVEQMPQAGWSETVDASEVQLKEIWAKVREFKGFENGRN